MVSNKNTRVQITMPKELYKLLDKISKDCNITISQLVNITIISFLDNKVKSIENKIDKKEIKENEKNI